MLWLPLQYSGRYCSQDEPFTSHLPETLFNIARYLLHMMVKECPAGVSKVYPLHPSSGEVGGGGGLCGFTRFGRPGKSKFVHENHRKSVLYMNKTKRYSAYGLKTWKLIKLQHCKVQAWKTLEINFWSRIALENQICV